MAGDEVVERFVVEDSGVVEWVSNIGAFWLLFAEAEERHFGGFGGWSLELGVLVFSLFLVGEVVVV